MVAYKQALEAVGAMARVLEEAKGVEGKAVIAQSTSGIVITRSGRRILDLAFTPSEPIYSLILKSTVALHEKLGDGVKSYVVLVNNLLQLVNHDSPVHRLVVKLQTLESKLHECFSSVTCDCALTKDTVFNVIQTFFSTRFTSIVSQTLSKLVYDWVYKLGETLELGDYLCNFDILCLKFNPFPLFASIVQDGFLLPGIWSRRLPHNNGDHCHVYIYYRPVDMSSDPGEIEADILGILKETYAQGLTKILFVTNIFIQERARFLLNRRNIYTIHSVSVDSVKYLFERSLPLGRLVTKYCFINDLLWISIENVCQLLIKAPNATIAAEYADHVRDCLKMLHFSFKELPCTVPSGGFFEEALVRKVFSQNKSLGLRLPPVKSREQILAWKNTSIRVELLRHINVAVLINLDTDVVDMFCRALLPTNTVQNNLDKVEPLALRLNIILKSLNTFISLLNTDTTLIKPKKGRLV